MTTTSFQQKYCAFYCVFEAKSKLIIPFLLFISIIRSDLRGEMLSRAKRYVTVFCPVHLLLFLCIENSTKFWMFSLCSFLSPRSTLYLVFYPPPPTPPTPLTMLTFPVMIACVPVTPQSSRELGESVPPPTSPFQTLIYLH